MRMRITAPVEGYSGDGPGGLVFVEGLAETDDLAVIGYCQGAGYDVEPVEEDEPTEQAETVEEVKPQDTKPAARTARRKGDA
jgi:hypothetical protein